MVLIVIMWVAAAILTFVLATNFISEWMAFGCRKSLCAGLACCVISASVIVFGLG